MTRDQMLEADLAAALVEINRLRDIISTILRAAHKADGTSP